VHFKKEIEQRVEFEMCPATARWVLSHSEYLRWRRDESCELLWLHGSPGSGKSFLTSFIFNQLSLGAIPDYSGIAYFACDRLVSSRPRSNALVLYNTLIAQLLRQLGSHDDSAVNRILADLEACDIVGQLNTPFRLWKNLQLATSSFKSCYVLIDALDENEEWMDVLALLKRIVRESRGRIKLLISSRSWDTIRELISDKDGNASTAITLDADLMSSDINAFVSWKIRDLDTRELGGKQKVLEDLVAGADGLMLLAQYRTERFIREAREGKRNLAQVLKSLPSEVNEYYFQSITRLETLSDRERSIATQIFIWTAFAERPLTFLELAEVLSFRLEGRGASGIETISRGLVDRLCQGMIVLRNDVVGASHGSVFNYLLEEGLPSMTHAYRTDHIKLDHTLVQAEIAGVLLNYMCSCPNPDLEKDTTWSQATIQKYPLLGYSITCWPPHAFAAKRIIPPAFAKFMQSPQHRHWWQCWSQGVESRPWLNTYTGLQGLFHTWVDSFLPHERKRELLDIAGPILPLRMTEEKLQLLLTRTDRQSDEHIQHTMIVLSLLYEESGQWNKALTTGEKALSMMPAINERSMTLAGVLAKIYGMQGDRLKEVEMKEQIVDFARSRYGPHHIQTIVGLDNLALGYNRLGRHSVANERSQEALKYAMDLLGEDNPETITVMLNRAVILLGMKSLDEALSFAKMAFEKMIMTMGSGHQSTIIAQDNLATIHYVRGEESAGRDLRFEAFTMALVSLGHEHPTTAQIFAELEMEFLNKEDSQALATLRAYRMRHYVNLYGEDDPRTLICMNQVLLAFMGGKDWEEAKRVGERLVNNLRPKKYDVHDGHLWRVAIQKLSKVYDFLGDYENGIILGEETLSFYLHGEGLKCEFGSSAARDLARMYHRVKDWGNAIRCGALAVEVATNLEGAESEATLRFKTELAAAFWSAKQYQAGFDLDLDVLNMRTRVYGATHLTTVEALLLVCEAMRPCKQKDLVLRFYEQLVLTQKLCIAAGGTDHESRAKIRHGLDELFRRVPEEWHPDMLAIE
jgi:tetratricopeptide (TPR) repeat protein